MLPYLPLLILIFGPMLFMLWLALRQIGLTSAALGIPREQLLPSWLREVLGGAVLATLLVLALIIALIVLLRQPLLTRAAYVLPWVFAFSLGVHLMGWQARWLGRG